MKEIVSSLLGFRNQIKLYHWKTQIYSKHKASDDFLEKMDGLIDKFVEVMIGSRGAKVIENFTRINVT